MDKRTVTKGRGASTQPCCGCKTKPAGSYNPWRTRDCLYHHEAWEIVKDDVLLPTEEDVPNLGESRTTRLTGRR